MAVCSCALQRGKNDGAKAPYYEPALKTGGGMGQAATTLAGYVKELGYA